FHCMLTTLRARLIASYIGVVLLALVLAAAALFVLVQGVEDEAIYRNLTSAGTILTPLIREAQRTGQPRPAILLELRGLNMRVLTLEDTNRVTFDTRSGAGSLSGYVLPLRPDENDPTRGRFRDAQGAV